MVLCKITGNLKNISRTASKNGLVIPDWTTLENGAVFFNPKTKTYHAVVQLPYQNLGDTEDAVRSRLNEAVMPGFGFIVRFYNKDEDTSRRATIEIGEWHLPERPTIEGCEAFGLKVLISMTEADFNAIPYKEDTSIEEPLPLAAREINLSTLNLSNRLSDIRAKLDAYATQIDKFDGKVQGIDLRKEGQRLIKIENALRNLFIANGVPFDTDHSNLVILGISEKYEVLYVVVNVDNQLKRFSIGFDAFKSGEAISNDRTIAYLARLSEIEDTNLNWGNFLQEFTLRPPQITPSAKKNNKTKNTNSGASNEEVTRVIRVADSKSVKTEEEFQREDRQLVDPELKKTIALTNETAVAFVGDNVFSNLGSLVQEINTIEDVYGNALNKAGLRGIVQQAIKCLSDQLPLDEVQKVLDAAKRFAEFLSLPCKQFLAVIQDQFGLELNAIPAFRDGILREVKACYNELPIEAKDLFLSEISERSRIPLSSIEDLNLVKVDLLVSASGINGDKIVSSICDADRKLIVDFLAQLNIELPDISFNVDFASLIPKIEIPTINLPDNLPTIDIMADLAEQIGQAILESLMTALVDTLKQILQDIVDNCGDVSKVNFGQYGVDDILRDTFNEFQDSERFKEAKANLIRELAISIDLGDLPQIINDVSGLLDDLSSILTTGEISNLLNGNPNITTQKAVDCLTSTKYASLKPALDNPSKVEDLFKNLGDLVEKDLLLEQVAQVEYGNLKLNCDTEPNNIRESILKGKGLKPDQIEQQLKNTKARKLARLTDLANLLERDDLLDGAIPPIFCAPGKKDGLASKNHPSFKHALNKTLDLMYDGVGMAFDQDVNTFPSSIREQKTTNEDQREIPRKKRIDDPDNPGEKIDIQNPEYIRLISQGVSVEDPDDLDGKPVKIFEEDPLGSTFGKTFVAKGLRNNFRSIETDERIFSIDQDRIRLSLPSIIDPKNIVVPTDISQLSSFAQTIADLDLSEHKILYRVLDSTRDAYSISIERTSKNADPQTIFSYTRFLPIDETALSYINDKRLNKKQDITPQESYFSDFVVRSWANGGTIRINNQEVPKPNYARGAGDTGNQRRIDEELRDYFIGNTYYQLFRDILSAAAVQTSTSPMFRADILSLVPFVPEKKKGCDNGLLELEKIKKKMLEDYEKSDCDDDEISTDGLGKQPGTLEKAGLSGAVETTIRLHVIELALRNIFSLSSFKITKAGQVDDVILTYYVDQINKNLQQLSVEYRNKFLEQAVRTYNDKIERKEIQETRTSDSDVAVRFLTKEQILSVFDKISKLTGTSGELDLNKILVEEWLPLFDVGYNDDLRFSIQNQPGNNDLASLAPIREQRRNNYQTIFSLENGNFILEKYIRVVEKAGSKLSNPSMNNGRNDDLYGVVNVAKWNEYISSLDSSIVLKDEIEELRYGLRLVYLPPVREDDFKVNVGLSAENPITRALGAVSSNGKLVGESSKNKALMTQERATIINSGNSTNLIRRTYPIPLISVERLEDLSAVSISTNFQERWSSFARILEGDLLSSPEYAFLFNYCFPIGRISSLVMLYSIVYLSNIKKVVHLFDGTKQQLRTLFEALLNVGNYAYEDSYISEIGGNAGAMSVSQNNMNTDNDTPGVSLAAIAARTPLLILKGLVEISDPNIGLARKIVDGAKANNKNIPIQLASLLQMPMNIFPPPPFGPGIGPPITPLGFVYLATDVDGALDSAQGAETKRNSVKADLGLDLDADKCEDK